MTNKFRRFPIFLTCLLTLAGVATPLLRPAINRAVFQSLSPSPEAPSSPTTADPDSLKLPFPISDEGDVPSQPGAAPQSSPTGVDLKNPDNSQYSAIYDPESGAVTIYRRIGGMDVRLPYSMSYEDYQNDAIRRSMIDFWNAKQRQAGNADRGTDAKKPEERKNSLLNSKWEINSDAFASIFGSNNISMKLQGQAMVSIGAQYNKIDNPTLQERMRATTSFDFDQSVQINLNSQIGEKLKLGINYNTQATFSFENEVKLEYNGDEDDIIQDIEAGNINWSLPGTLIQGSQSLFGFKMDMKFGKLTVSTVFSQKKGESNSITVQNGATAQEFEIDVTDYEKNKHFFLSQRFKDMYDQALRHLPTINSGISISKLEVWVTNKSGNYTDARNVVAFADLAESGSDIQNTSMWHGQSTMPSNDANNLYDAMTTSYSAVRDPNSTTQILSSINGMRTGRDYEKVENARLLSSSEYTLNEHLGYISLNSPLNNNEVLAVAYQYTYRGQTYTVGELSTSGVNAPSCLYLKMLKGTTFTPQYKVWDLMMKNVYSLGGYEIKSEDFEVDIVYLNDSTSSYINYFNEGRKPINGGQNGQTYLQILNLDRLNSYNEVGSDGKYDYVSGVTVNAARGLIIFPEREPFGDYLADKLKDDPALAEKYAFQALYDSTQVYAKQQTKKNKFKIKGQFQSQNSSDISLNAYNVAQGSVVVTAGGQILTENVDYTVDYSLGRVRILNQGLLSSGTAINISYENEAAISTQTQTLVGAHLNYEINDDFNVGGTVIHMKERPLTNKVSYGEESVSNTMLGLNVNYSHKLPFLTEALDALPLVSTKAESSIDFEGEVAKLIAGHSNSINAAYIDDFEGSSVKYDIKAWSGWHLASRPSGSGALTPDNTTVNDLSAGFDRARLAWYSIDPLFLRNMTNTPRHIRNDLDQQSSHYVREVYEDELYPNREAAYGESTNISMLNLAYYPDERGPYNFTTDLDVNGHLTDPESKWAGIQRKLETTDFENANIEYIEFWMMDPFVYDQSPTRGGDLYFHIGSVSEDVLPDSRKSFEHGLPVPGEDFNVDSTAWGYIPRTNSLVKGFNTDAASMRAQDVGLNGMSSERERYFYNKSEYPYLDMIRAMYQNGNLTEEAYNDIINDPAGDDYHYYRGSDYDQQQVSILDRYKKFNNPEGNSCPSEYSPESYSTASTNQPDNEDLNDDYTLNENESYYQYHISLRPDSMMVGHNYIADQMETTTKLRNGNTETIKWYQFKIPVSEPERVIGDLSDMTSMQFIRLFMTGFQDTCIVRLATLELVKGEWRKYTESLVEDDGHESAATTFSTTTVNIEENDRRNPVSYVLPPGVDRVVDPSNPQLRQLNEQAYSIKVTDLANGDARAVYKKLNMDFRNYRRLKMYIHAEAMDGYPLEDNQMSAFVRIGSDYEDNYYEYEIPLKLTPHGTYTSNSESDRYAVWPLENELDIPISVLTECKLARNEERRKANSNITLQDVYTMVDPDNNNNRVRIKGNPSTGNVVVMMMGLRAHGAGTKSAEVWFNELRLADFDERGGWAARGRATLRLADLGTVQASGQYSSVGFGSIDQSVLERSMSENRQFDISANFEVGKFFGPNSRLSLPVFAGYSRTTSMPRYSPYDTDVLMSTVLAQAKTKAEEDSLKEISQTKETIKSLNFTNVRVKPAKGKRVTVISPSNLSASYSLSTTEKSDPETEYDLTRQQTGSLAYDYAAGAKTVQPFKKTNLSSKYLALIKDLTLYTAPSQLGYRWEFDRDYQEVQKRNITNPDYKVPISVTKEFFWNRYFDFRYNITRNLKFGFNAVVNARIDEPDGPVNKDLYPDEYKHWRDSVWSNIRKFGKTHTYQHNVDINWTIPINKLPYLNFLTANASYKGVYNWQRGSETSDYDWGNTISNKNTEQANAMANLGTLYNKSKYLRDLYDHYNLSNSTRQQRQSQANKTKSYTQQNQKLTVGQPVEIRHNLNTTDISARAFDDRGHSIKGSIEAKDANSAIFTPTMASKSARIVVTGVSHDDDAQSRNVFKDMALMVATSIKNISLSYSENNSTILPGYMMGSHFLGSDNGLNAPGFKFITGIQDRNFALDAVSRGWLTTDSTFNEPYEMTHSQNLQLRSSIELFKALKIELTAQHNKSHDLSEYYLFNAGGFAGVFNTVENGSASLTLNAIHTAFKHASKTGNLDFSVYDDFLRNRYLISQRLYEQRIANGYGTGVDAGEREDGGRDGYGLSSQEVMIPAFIAAYTGTNTSSVFLDLIPKISAMRPNWRITFSGLNNIKALAQKVRNIEINHSYTSKYTVGQYTTNLDWVDNGNGVTYIRDINGNYVPRYDASSVSIAEQFSPLIGISATFVNNMTASFSSNKSRTITLSVNNNQITENYSNDWTASLGYRFDNLKLFAGKHSKDGFNNTLNLTFTLSLRDQYTLLRRIEEMSSELASGSKNTQVKFAADYAFTSKFNVQFYYDQSLAKPYISSSYPTNNINVGFSFLLQLTE